MALALEFVALQKGTSGWPKQMVLLRTSKSDHLHLTSPRQDKVLCFWFPHHPKLVDSLLAMALEFYRGGPVVMLMRSSILRSVRLGLNACRLSGAYSWIRVPETNELKRS
jgi:hypothetical protein